MADSVSTIQELRARWEAEPTSRVFLQLAEEHRRAGQVDEALRVLEVGLKRVPNHPSAHVALARCHLDAGDGSQARDVLEQVVRKDATHLVANKLLVQAYLETGELAQARERLTYYGLLNDRDPEHQELRDKLEAAESARSPDVEPVAAAAAPAAEPVPEEVAEEEPAPLPVPEAPEDFVVESAEGLFEVDGFAGEEVDEEVTGADDRAEDGARAAESASVQSQDLTRQAPPGSEDDLFPDVTAASDRDRYLSALESEGLFFAPPAAAPPSGDAEDGVIFHLPPVGDEDVPSLPRPGFHPMAAGLVTEEPDVEAVTPGTLETLHLPASPLPSASAAESEGEPEGSAVAEARREHDVAAAAAAPLDAEAESLPGAETEPEPVEAPAPETVPEPPINTATATLGQLYLQQGHRQEAEKIFRKVLAEEPTNPVALAGLRIIAQADRAERVEGIDETAPSFLQARDLFAGAEGTGLTVRKVQMLEGYLRRLRREA